MVESKLLKGTDENDGKDIVDPGQIGVDVGIGEKDFTAKRGARMSLSPVMQ